MAGDHRRSPSERHRSKIRADAQPRQVIVVGAGLAGLTAAYVLARRGLMPLVLEAQAQCGGRLQTTGATTIELDGTPWSFPDEHGIHGIWTHYRNVRALLDSLGLRESLIDAQGQAWVHGAGDRAYSFEVGTILRRSPLPAPLHYASLVFQPRFLRLLGPLDLLRLPVALGSLVAAGSFDPADEAGTMEGKRLPLLLAGWPRALQALIASLARNGLSADPHDVPLSGFIAWLRFYSLLRRDSWGFSYLRGDGGARFVDPLLAAAQASGATVRTGARVDALRLGADGAWSVALARPASRGREHDAAGEERSRHLVVAVDAPGSRSILTAASSSTSEVSARIRWPEAQPTVVVREWFRVLPRLEAEAGVFSGDFAADNFFWLQNFHDGAYLWHRQTGGSVVEVHVYGPPALLALGDAELERRVVEDLGRAFPEVKGRRVAGRVRRNPPTHTLYRVGHRDDQLGIETPWPRLWCCGDWIRHATPALFLERACTTGILAANAVLRERGLDEWPVLAPPPAEPLAALIDRGLRALRGKPPRQAAILSPDGDS